MKQTNGKYIQLLKFVKIKNNFLGMLEVQEKKIKLLKLIWKLRFCINSKKQGLFDKDRIPFNWYKLGLLHILCFEKIKDVDFWDLKWPIFPLEREEIVKLKKTITYYEVEKLFFQAENFWVNNNFKSSPKEILNSLKNT